MKQDFHSPKNCNSGADFPSSTCAYDLNYNNNSNDWLNAGCKGIHNSNDWLNAGCKCIHSELSPTSAHAWPQNSLYLQQATVVEAAWSYSNFNY